MWEVVGTYYYFFPTYAQGKKILWDGRDRSGMKFTDHIPKEIRTRTNNSDMIIETKNGSLFQVIGVDKVDSVVGTNPIGTVWSEYSLQHPRGWDFIRPILAENDGWAIFNYTPRGKNHAYDLHMMALKYPEEWWVQLLTVDDTKAISPKALERERIEIIAKHGDDSLFQQEYFCSYVVALIGAYYGKIYAEMEKKNRFTNVPYEEGLPVHTVWDLGIDDAMAVGFYQSVGLERRKIDYEEYFNLGLPQAIAEVKKKPYAFGKHFFPFDIKTRDLSTGKKRKDVADKLLGEDNVVVIPKMDLMDGIDRGRAFFRKLWADKENCDLWLKAIPQYTKDYDEENKKYRDTPRHDWTSHAADEHRYAATIEDQMTNEDEVVYKQKPYEPSSLLEGGE